jgi:hypothetical protein
MANEPEHPIEKLLREAAEKRRDAAGAPFELHPATRRLLQGEAVRQYGKPQRQGRSLLWSFAQLWPRLAWGVGIVAVLGVAVWMIVPATRGNKSAALLDKNEPPRRMAATGQAAPAAAPAPSTAPAMREEEQPRQAAAPVFANKEQAASWDAAAQLGVEQNQPARDSFQSKTAPEPLDKLLPPPGWNGTERKQPAKAEVAISGGVASQPSAEAVSGVDSRRHGSARGPAAPANAPLVATAPPASTTADASTVLADAAAKPQADRTDQAYFAYKAAPNPASANRLQPAPAATDALVAASEAVPEKQKGLRISQRFAQVALDLKATSSRDEQAAAASPVLASFQVEQTGAELRVVDGDGSVYRGYLQGADTATRARALKLESPAAGKSSPATTGQFYSRSADRLDADHVLLQAYTFRVVGTNRSLQQKVVFTGSLLPAAPAASTAPAVTNPRIGVGFGGAQAGAAHSLASPLQNSRISGKVVVGNAKAVQIDAEPSQ